MSVDVDLLPVEKQREFWILKYQALEKRLEEQTMILVEMRETLWGMRDFIESIFNVSIEKKPFEQSAPNRQALLLAANAKKRKNIKTAQDRLSTYGGQDLTIVDIARITRFSQLTIRNWLREGYQLTPPNTEVLT